VCNLRGTIKILCVCVCVCALYSIIRVEMAAADNTTRYVEREEITFNDSVHTHNAPIHNNIIIQFHV